ncbi:hypothetical protein XPA_010371 [Xanthoria parietina]
MVPEIQEIRACSNCIVHHLIGPTIHGPLAVLRERVVLSCPVCATNKDTVISPIRLLVPFEPSQRLINVWTSFATAVSNTSVLAFFPVHFSPNCCWESESFNVGHLIACFPSKSFGYLTVTMLDLIVKRAALPYSPLDYCILAAATAVAWVFVIELDLTVFLTFRRRSGLYFWSLLVSSWGCALHAIGFILNFLVGSGWHVTLPFIEIGWVTMVTGQAFVLYSRLHLVVRNQKTLRYILWMIIIDGICFHVPTIVFTVGINSPDQPFWQHKFDVMERIQLVGFTLQECTISTLYIVSTVRILGAVYHSMTRKVMLQLILINLVCIGMDIVLIGLEFSAEYTAEASIKPMVYAIKLKLEFTVLNQLMGLSKAGFTEGSRWMGNGGPSHHSHELKDRTFGSTSDPEAPPPRRAVGNWASVGPRAMRGSVTNGRNMAAGETDPHIIKTQDIEVVTEMNVANKEASTSSSSTAITGVTGPPGLTTEPPSKVKQLMGTVPNVYLPGRRDRTSRPDATRSQSPSESEKEIIRSSSDDEKGGTWAGSHTSS